MSTLKQLEQQIIQGGMAVSKDQHVVAYDKGTKKFTYGGIMTYEAERCQSSYLQWFAGWDSDIWELLQFEDERNVYWDEVERRLHQCAPVRPLNLRLSQWDKHPFTFERHGFEIVVKRHGPDDEEYEVIRGDGEALETLIGHFYGDEPECHDSYRSFRDWLLTPPFVEDVEEVTA